MRNRLTRPILTPNLHRIDLEQLVETNKRGLFALLKVTIKVSNEGRIAAYDWAFVFSQLAKITPDRVVINESDFPDGVRLDNGGIRLKDTILPTRFLFETIAIGIYFPRTGSAVRALSEIRSVLPKEAEIHCHTVTETGAGPAHRLQLGDSLKTEELFDQMRAALERNHPAVPK